MRAVRRADFAGQADAALKELYLSNRQDIAVAKLRREILELAASGARAALLNCAAPKINLPHHARHRQDRRGEGIAGLDNILGAASPLTTYLL